MSAYKDEILTARENNRRVSLNNNPDPKFAYPYLKKGMVLGMQAGAGMALILTILQFSEWQMSFVYWRYVKYLVLFGFLVYGIKQGQSEMGNNWRFDYGIRIGAIATAVSAMTVLLINGLYFTFVDGYDFSKFNKEVVDVPTFWVVNGAVFVEIIVFGMIATFLALQLLKREIK